jgi:prepilin-type N-terminal cleavage/methylation domain-containing protein/prepilin-type processing-associated H-X9-DG protein
MYRTAGSRRGFTLVELLVVITIIALLAALLLPTLSAAKGAAQRTVCLSNIRQIGTALIAYSVENQGKFPNTSSYGRSGGPDPLFHPAAEDWIYYQANRDINQSRIARFIGHDDLLQRILRCPADDLASHIPASDADPAEGIYSYSYTLNIQIWTYIYSHIPSLTKTPWDVANPSQKIMLTEEINPNDGGWAAWDPTDRLTPRHGRTANAAFFDGHAEPITQAFALDQMHWDPPYTGNGN